MDITQVLTIFAIVATNLATVLILYVHQDSKTSSFLKAIHDEMKDFHARLCVIEERTKR